MSLPALPSESGLALPSGMCPLCGAGTAPGQEYCLECGERLTGLPVHTGDAVAHILPFTRRPWFWPAVAGFFVAGLLAGAGVEVWPYEKIMLLASIPTSSIGFG